MELAAGRGIFGDNLACFPLSKIIIYALANKSVCCEASWFHRLLSRVISLVENICPNLIELLVNPEIGMKLFLLDIFLARVVKSIKVFSDKGPCLFCGARIFRYVPVRVPKPMPIIASRRRSLTGLAKRELLPDWRFLAKSNFRYFV